MKAKLKQGKTLIIDIETSPLVAFTWGIFDQNIGLNQIKEDSFILSFAAKWLGNDEVIYYDQRERKDKSNDKRLVQKIWKLLNQSDVVLGQNSKRFDIKKINTRFIVHGLKPPSSYRQIDTLSIAKKHFGFTSNKLEFMTNKLCTKYKKLTHKKFPGFELWKECLKGNLEAWKEMERYNKHDVLATEELYLKLRPWDNSINHSVYSDVHEQVCSCGSKEFKKNGFQFTNFGKYQRYKCTACGAEMKDRFNLIPLEQRKNLLVPVK